MTYYNAVYCLSASCKTIQGGKTDAQFHFLDNFRNSARILSILSLLQDKQKFMERKHELHPPTTPLLCDHIT